MALSIGISHLALITPPGRTPIRQSLRSSFSSQAWQLSNFTSVSLRVRPNYIGVSCGQAHHEEAAEGVSARSRLSADNAAADRGFAEDDFVEGVSARMRLSAGNAADRGGFAENDFADPVGYNSGGVATLRAAPQRSNGKFWRRFPGPLAAGTQDVTVPFETLRTGAVFWGIVSSVQPFGAFVNFGAFADGLIHISKLSTGYVKSVSDVVEMGQEVMVSIVKVEGSTGRISLSLVEKDQIDRRKPYVSPGREEVGRRGERPRFQSGAGGSALTIGEREERVYRGSHASSSRLMESREGGEQPRYQPESRRFSQSTAEEEQERFSRNPYASSRQREARREGGEKPRFQPGSGRRSPFLVEEVEKNTRNPFGSTRRGEAGEEDPGSKNPFASSREGQSRGEDRESKNPFVSSSQREAREEDRNSFLSSRRKEGGEGGNSPRFPQQGNDGNLHNRGRITRFGSRADREEQTKPKKKLVQLGRDDDMEDGSVEDKASSRMRRVTSSWYECDCC